jgi:hypothetical protein
LFIHNDAHYYEDAHDDADDDDAYYYACWGPVSPLSSPPYPAPPIQHLLPLTTHPVGHLLLMMMPTILLYDYLFCRTVFFVMTILFG